MIIVSSFDGFQNDQSGSYCYLQDANGYQVGTIEVENGAVTLYVTRSNVSTSFDIGDISPDDDDLPDMIIDSLFSPLNWDADSHLIQSIIDAIFKADS